MRSTSAASWVEALDLLATELGAEVVVPAIDHARGRGPELEAIALRDPQYLLAGAF